MQVAILGEWADVTVTPTSNTVTFEHAFIMSFTPIFICHNPSLCNASKYQNYVS